MQYIWRWGKGGEEEEEEVRIKIMRTQVYLKAAAEDRKKYTPNPLGIKEIIPPLLQN